MKRKVRGFFAGLGLIAFSIGGSYVVFPHIYPSISPNGLTNWVLALTLISGFAFLTGGVIVMLGFAKLAMAVSVKVVLFAVLGGVLIMIGYFLGLVPMALSLLQHFRIIDLLGS
ncbi:hypothetical protein KKB83_03665 [Patescibacteria group bacterium]|nr:hypothetical protein [Patescibacteria group bacterium]